MMFYPNSCMGTELYKIGADGKLIKKQEYHGITINNFREAVVKSEGYNDVVLKQEYLKSMGNKEIIIEMTRK